MYTGLLRLFPVPTFLHPHAVGISIEDDQVTLVQKAVPLETCDATQVVLPPGVVERGEIVNPEQLISSLKRLRKQCQSSEVVLALPTDAGFLVRMEIDPEVTNVHEAVLLGIEEYIPVNPADLTLDFEVVGYEKKSGWRVLVAAYPTMLIRAYEDALKQAGFVAVAAELVPHALARAVTEGKEGESVLVFSVGRTRSHAIIMVGYRPWTVTSIELGWQQLVEVCQRSVDTLKLGEAERTVFRYGFSRLHSKELVDLMSPTAAVFRDEINKIIGFWASHRERSWGNARTIEDVVLVGRGGGIPGMSKHLGAGLSARVRAVSPWEDAVYDSPSVPSIERAASLSYAGATGAFIRATRGAW